MKIAKSPFAFLVALAFLSSSVFAAQTISGEINDDLYFLGGVLLADVTLPSNLNASTGSSTAAVEGAGTVTVASRTGGGLPRMTVFGGTNITSARDWGDANTKSWWEGQLEPPKRGRTPKADQISHGTFISADNTLTVLDSFSFGLPNETFSFSTPVSVALPVAGEDNIKLWIAFKQGDGSWSVSGNDFCLAQQNVCTVEIASVNEMALVKENFSRCPRTSIANGRIGSPPSCKILCDNGYELNESLTSCVEKQDDFSFGTDQTISFDSFGGDSGGEELLSDDESDGFFFSTQGLRFSGGRQLLNEREAGWRAKLAREKDEAKKTLTPEQQLERAHDDSFLNYLLQMRNHFGGGVSANVFGEAAEGSFEEDAVATEGESQTLSSSTTNAPLLPSTGPGIFIGLAAMGVGMMIMGSRRD